MKGMLGEHEVLHVAIVVHNMEEALEAYCAFFDLPNPGYMTTGPYEDTNTHFMDQPTESRAKLAFLRLGAYTIELIEPSPHPSTWRDWLDKHGEGVHHLGFRVKEYDKVYGKMEESGMKAVHYGHGYAYMDTLKELKVLTELLS